MKKKRMGIEELSPKLDKALGLFEESELAKEALAIHIYKNFGIEKEGMCRILIGELRNMK